MLGVRADLHLRATAPAQFKRGVLLYTGEQVVKFDEQLIAVPIGFLNPGTKPKPARVSSR